MRTAFQPSSQPLVPVAFFSFPGLKFELSQASLGSLEVINNTSDIWIIPQRLRLRAELFLSSDGSTKQSAKVEKSTSCPLRVDFVIIFPGSSASRAQGILIIGWLCIQTVDACSCDGRPINESTTIPYTEF